MVYVSKRYDMQSGSRFMFMIKVNPASNCSIACHPLNSSHTVKL